MRTDSRDDENRRNEDGYTCGLLFNVKGMQLILL